MCRQTIREQGSFFGKQSLIKVHYALTACNRLKRLFISSRNTSRFASRVVHKPWMNGNLFSTGTLLLPFSSVIN